MNNKIALLTFFKWKRIILVSVLFPALMLSIVSNVFALNCSSPPSGWGSSWWSEYASWCSQCGGTPNSSNTSCTPGPNWGGGGGGRGKDHPTIYENSIYPDRQDELRRQREDDERRRKQEAEDAARKREEKRKKQFEEDKQDALNLLKSGAGKLGLKGVSDSDGVKLKGTGQTGLKLKEPKYSKGTKGSAPVQLKSLATDKPKVISPETMKMKTGAKEKGLKTGYVPKPAFSSLADYQYDKKSRIDIVLDALEVGKGSYIKSVEHLESYLKEVEPNDLKVQEAMSYIQGMAEGEYVKKEAERTKHKGPFDPNAADSYALLDDIAKMPEQSWWQKMLMAITPEEAIEPPASPPIWLAARNSVIEETVIEQLPEDYEKWTAADFERCIQSLKEKKQKYPIDEGISQALQFFEGAAVHY